MLFIFGWGRVTRSEVGYTKEIVCPVCSRFGQFKLVTARTWFTLFFVPVIPYEKDNYAICRTCSNGISLSDRQLIELKSGAVSNLNAISTFQQIPFPSIGKSEKSSSLGQCRRCANCDALMSPTMIICPRCHKKIDEKEVLKKVSPESINQPYVKPMTSLIEREHSSRSGGTNCPVCTNQLDSCGICNSCGFQE
jgi:hypothetical protein